MKRWIVISMVCALCGVAVASAQEPGQAGTGGGETEACEHHGRGHGRGHGRHMFERMDADGDGRVTRAEAMAKAEAHFKQLDANNDGVVTQQEAAEHHRERREQMRGQGHGPRGPHSNARGARAAAGTRG